ncbi:MAG: tetratricopeptide repeat protein [Treponema sp.]|nr:tetratricopeptide repeat protein [Treponema sp.]
MAATQEKQDKKNAETAIRAGELTAAEKLIEFIQRNRRILFAAFVLITVGLLGSLIGFAVRERLTSAAFSAIDGFEQRLIELAPYVGSEEVEALLRQGEITALLEELAVFAARNSGFAAASAHGLRADIFDRQERWDLSERAWLSAADAAPLSYFAPIALFNAAAAAEEHGDLGSALDLHSRIIREHERAFFVAVRAYFAVGRLEEARGNTEAALAAYRGLLSRWPQDPLYANLAQSRIILLSY